MLTEDRRAEIRVLLARLTDAKRLPIDNMLIEAALITTLRALLEADAEVTSGVQA